MKQKKTNSQTLAQSSEFTNFFSGCFLIALWFTSPTPVYSLPPLPSLKFLPLNWAGRGRGCKIGRGLEEAVKFTLTHSPPRSSILFDSHSKIGQMKKSFYKKKQQEKLLKIVKKMKHVQ